MPGSEFFLELDRRRKLKFGFRAMRLIKEKVGDKDIRDLENMAETEMPIVAWAGLNAEDPNLTIEQVEALLDDSIPERYTVAGIITVLVKAITAHMVGPGAGGSKKGGGGSGDKRSENISTEPEKPPSA